MYATRQPITTSNYRAFETTQRALAPETRPYQSSIARDVEGEMANLFRENPGLTIEELGMTGKFDLKQIERYGKSAAARAGRESVRRVA